jgi:hypothetical protein
MDRMKLLQHIYNTDVAMAIHHKRYIPSRDGYEVKLVWFNVVNCDNIFVIERDKVFIKAADMGKWREFNETKNQ